MRAATFGLAVSVCIDVALIVGVQQRGNDQVGKRLDVSCTVGVTRDDSADRLWPVYATYHNSWCYILFVDGTFKWLQRHGIIDRCRRRRHSCAQRRRRFLYAYILASTGQTLRCSGW